MFNINVITNASERDLTVHLHGETYLVVPAMTEHSFGSSPLAVPESHTELRFEHGGTGLVNSFLSIYSAAGSLKMTYSDPDFGMHVPDLSCKNATYLTLLFITRPHTDAQNNTTASIWVIGDVDTGGGQ